MNASVYCSDETFLFSHLTAAFLGLFDEMYLDWMATYVDAAFLDDCALTMSLAVLAGALAMCERAIVSERDECGVCMRCFFKR